MTVIQQRVPSGLWECECCNLKATIGRQTRSQAKKACNYIPIGVKRKHIEEDSEEEFSESDHNSDSDY